MPDMSFIGNTAAPKQDDYGGDEISALVLDPGSSTTRAGFAGEDAPKSVVATYYGRTSSTPYIFGDESLHSPSPGIEIRNPMSEDGTVEDWDAAQKLWEFTIKSRLIAPSQRDPMRNGLNETPKEEDGEKQEGQAMDIDGVDESEVFLAENPLLMTEPAWNSVKNREKSIEIAMESWGAPAFWIQRSGVLAAFASGKPSALVVDVGARSTSITPVHDGMILRKGALHSPLAGDFISSQLRLQFASNKPAPITFTPSYLVAHKVPVEAGQPALASYRSFSPESAAPHPSFRRLQEEKVLHEFKESVVEVWNKGGLFNSSSAGMSNEERATGEIARPFEFPDGFNQVFTSDAFKAAEGLFDPRSAFTDDTNPAPDAKRALPAMIQQSLNAVDIDTRPYLMANVVVVGGGSLVRGFTDRLNQELGALYPAPKLRLHAAGNLYERRFASWIGGSILASLGTFHQMWISKKEYEETGPSIVEKRCK